jgi:hypothetical protein
LFKEWLPQLHGASPSAALDESYEVVFMIARHRLSVKVILIFGAQELFFPMQNVLVFLKLPENIM